MEAQLGDLAFLWAAWVSLLRPHHDWERLPALVSGNGKELRFTPGLSELPERKEAITASKCLSSTRSPNNSLWVRQGHPNIALCPKLTFLEGTAWQHVQCQVVVAGKL